MTLKELQIGKSAVVDTVGGAGALRQHFLDMGLIPGAEVTLVKLAPICRIRIPNFSASFSYAAYFL